MRATKVKEIRRQARKYIAESGERWISHPSVFVNVLNEKMLKFTFQYLATGQKQVVKLAKKFYKLNGRLPRE